MTRKTWERLAGCVGRLGGFRNAKIKSTRKKLKSWRQWKGRSWCHVTVTCTHTTPAQSVRHLVTKSWPDESPSSLACPGCSFVRSSNSGSLSELQVRHIFCKPILCSWVIAPSSSGLIQGTGKVCKQGTEMILPVWPHAVGLAVGTPACRERKRLVIEQVTWLFLFFLLVIRGVATLS